VVASAALVPLAPPSVDGARVEESAAWQQKLPSEAPKVKVGAQAWALLPQAGGSLFELAIVRVDALGPGTVAVIDRMQQRIDGVPAALVHPTGETRNLRQGTLALFYTPTTPGFVGWVSHSQRGDELRVKYDWAGKTRETEVEHAEALRRGVAPLAWVRYPKGATTSLGLVVAADGERAFILEGSGEVTIVASTKVSPAELRARGLAIGERVDAYRWAFGVRSATVTREVESGLRYEVAFSSGQPSTTSFVAALVAP
jgi:hypothetical protein